MTKLEQGRPISEDGRLEKEIRTYDLLDDLGIPYERMDHQPMATIEDCHEVDEVLGVEICKNLFLCNSQQTKFYLLLIPGKKKFKTKDLSHQLGVARLSFAKAEFLEQYLDITPGAVSIMGLMNDRENRVQLLIDKEVAENEYLACHPCVNTSSIKMKTGDVLEKFLTATGHNPIFVEL